MTFGIQPEQVDYIESELKRWKNEQGIEMLYSYHFWDGVAKKFMWERLTICLAYLEHKRDQNKLNLDINSL